MSESTAARGLSAAQVRVLLENEYGVVGAFSNDVGAHLFAGWVVKPSSGIGALHRWHVAHDRKENGIAPTQETTGPSAGNRTELRKLLDACPGAFCRTCLAARKKEADDLKAAGVPDDVGTRLKIGQIIWRYSPPEKFKRNGVWIPGRALDYDNLWRTCPRCNGTGFGGQRRTTS